MILQRGYVWWFLNPVSICPSAWPSPQIARHVGPMLAQRGADRIHVGPTWGQQNLLSGTVPATGCVLNGAYIIHSADNEIMFSSIFHFNMLVSVIIISNTVLLVDLTPFSKMADETLQTSRCFDHQKLRISSTSFLRKYSVVYMYII